MPHEVNLHGQSNKNGSTEWATPQALFDTLDNEFCFTLDPCSTAKNAKCARFFSIDEDGLSKSWAGERVYMNPPYGLYIGHWLAKAYKESVWGTLVVCLVPARTDTRWWHNYVMRASEIRLIAGRLKFNDAGMSAPFPSAIVIFRATSQYNKALQANTGASPNLVACSVNGSAIGKDR